MCEVAKRRAEVEISCLRSLATVGPESAQVRLTVLSKEGCVEFKSHERLPAFQISCRLLVPCVTPKHATQECPLRVGVYVYKAGEVALKDTSSPEMGVSESGPPSLDHVTWPCASYHLSDATSG